MLLLVFSILCPTHSFPSLFTYHHLPPPPCLLFTPSSSHLPFIFRNGQVSHEHRQNMIYPVSVRLGLSPCLKATKYEK